MERKANRIFDKKRIKLFEAFSGSYESKRCLNLFRVKRAPQKCLWVYVKELENER